MSKEKVTVKWRHGYKISTRCIASRVSFTLLCILQHSLFVDYTVGESSTSSKVRNDIVQFGVVLSQVRELLAEEVSSERTGDVEHYFQPDKLLGYPEALCALQEICLEDEMVKPTMRFCAKLLQVNTLPPCR